MTLTVHALHIRVVVIKLRSLTCDSPFAAADDGASGQSCSSTDGRATATTQRRASRRSNGSANNGAADLTIDCCLISAATDLATSDLLAYVVILPELLK